MNRKILKASKLFPCEVLYNKVVPSQVIKQLDEQFLSELLKDIYEVFGRDIEIDELYNILRTMGFSKALSKTCNTLGKSIVLEFYGSLDWQDGDYFDSMILDFIERIGGVNGVRVSENIY